MWGNFFWKYDVQVCRFWFILAAVKSLVPILTLITEWMYRKMSHEVYANSTGGGKWEAFNPPSKFSSP